jgi:hypothetical protein
MRGNPRCRRPARCVVKRVYATHFTSLFFTLQPATHLLRPSLPAATSSTVLHHAPAFRCPPQHPTAPTSTKIPRHLNWLLRAHTPTMSFAPGKQFHNSCCFTHPNAPTPCSEPVLVDRILTVSEVNTIFLKSLIESAEDFLGKQITGTVISAPSTFTDIQKDALEKGASDVGVKVLQLLDEAGATAATTTTPKWSAESHHKDRTQLIIDLGSSSVSLNVLSVREGLAYSLASSHSSSVGANHIDD